MTTSGVNKPRIQRIRGSYFPACWLCESKNAYAYGQSPKDAWLKWAAQLKWTQ